MKLGRWPHGERLMGTLAVELSPEGVEPLLLLDPVEARRAASCLRVGYMPSRRPFCCGRPGRMHAIAMPSRSHQSESSERWNRPFGLANGRPYGRSEVRIFPGPPGFPRPLNEMQLHHAID